MIAINSNTEMILLMELDNFTKHLQIFDMKQLLNFDITLS